MRKVTKRPKLYPVVVHLGRGNYYALRTTRGKVVTQILSHCENGKEGGKNRFIHTRPLSLSGSLGAKAFRRYVEDANKNWFVYKPMEFSTLEEAKSTLSKILGIDYDMVSFYFLSDT